jgi:hypothetical protein
MPWAGFEPTIPATNWPRPTPQTTRPLWPAIIIIVIYIYMLIIVIFLYCICIHKQNSLYYIIYITEQYFLNKLLQNEPTPVPSSCIICPFRCACIPAEHLLKSPLPILSLSVHMKQLDNSWMDFHKILCWEDLHIRTSRLSCISACWNDWVGNLQATFITTVSMVTLVKGQS